MIINATYTVRCQNQQEFLQAIEETKKAHPTLVMLSSSFQQRSRYNNDTRRYEYPGDFQGTITMGQMRTNDQTTDATGDVLAYDNLD